MPLELVNTIAAILTTTVIAATAIAATIQLRHMRAGNQIAGFMTLRNMLDDDAHQRADAVLVREGDLTNDETFRTYLTARAKREAVTPNDRYAEVYSALTMTANAFETLGTLVRNGVVDRQLFLEQYCSVVLGSWRRLEPYIALVRAAQNDDGTWEDFEYMAVLSERFIEEHPSMYPPGMPRLLPSYAKKS
ncbi:MAG: DUF4760 domain-containing protein [Candidatus Eremiobacteraeota bacterium]|nr:DUF4760 domain-containing protein [Candidatus Eremiobacteraeota bacterium]MBV8366557.1 DUF4760 domain-containing protein [Candidatus Eremiobacteraeota bacterium]